MKLAAVSKKAKARDLKSKFKIGSHYSMERFGILLCLVLVMFFVLVFFGVRDQIIRHQDALSTDTLYPSNYVTSRSGVVMAPIGVFANEARDSVVLLMKVGDTSKVGVKAEDYIMMLGAMNENGEHESLLSHPSVGFYFYPTAGYLAVTYQNGAPFPKQILYSIFRNCRDFSGKDTTEGALAEVYDVWTVNFNPGADGVIPTEAFNEKGEFSPDKFYYEVIVSQAEQQYRRYLTRSVDEMEDQLAEIKEFEQRVKEDGVVLDGMIPECVDGDEVRVLDDGSKKLITDTIATGGYDFDWFHGSISEGYVNSLVRGTTVSSPESLVATNHEIAAPFELPTEYVWKLTDGTLLDDTAKTNKSDKIKQAVSDVEHLEQLWSEYANTKYDYQVNELGGLLDLELDMNGSLGSWSANVNQDSVTYNED